MYDYEIMVFIMAIIMAIVGIGATSTAGLHGLYFRDNPGPGLVRLAVVLSLGWAGFVLWLFADESVTGIYILFYLVIGYALVKLCGQATAGLFGAHPRRDIGERRNMPAALVGAAFTLAVGLIYGGSLWGEADPEGDDEGGFWIPLTFFFLGWGALLISFSLWRRREGKGFARRMRQERSFADARAAAAFLLSAAVILTDAVAGDFWGWGHGLVTFGLLAALLIAHEGFAGLTRPGGGERDARRVAESLVYLGLAVVAWGLNRVVDAAWGPG